MTEVDFRIFRTADREYDGRPHTQSRSSLYPPMDTIVRDTGQPGCVFCHSIIVRVTTDTRQVAFCSCQLIEYRLLPKPTSRKANSAKP